MLKLCYFLVLLLSGLTLIGCNGQSNNPTSQDNICIVSELSELKAKCQPNDLVYFEPDRWGNEQLPTMFIALACNTNNPIYYTKAGVVCTYTERKTINNKPIGKNSESSN